MMRHAESEERLQSIRDHDRPITDEGRSSAREVHTQHPSVTSLLMLTSLLAVHADLLYIILLWDWCQPFGVCR